LAWVPQSGSIQSRSPGRAAHIGFSRISLATKFSPFKRNLELYEINRVNSPRRFMIEK
jgi:hypothetical protein